MVIGPTPFKTLASVRIAVHAKDRRTVIVIATTRQAATPLTTFVARAAILLLETGRTTTTCVMTDLIGGTTSLRTSPNTEPVGPADLPRHTIIIATTQIEAEAGVLIPPTTGLSVRAFTGSATM